MQVKARWLMPTAFAGALMLALPAMAQSGASARATLENPDGKAVGTVTATEQGAGVDLLVEVQGLPPGPHGWHVHEGGECAPSKDASTGRTVPFGAAGPHFDPLKSGQHGRPEQSAQQAHAGDLPNVEVGADGRGQLRHSTSKLTVRAGPQSLLGRAVVVHEKQDDYATNPAGNSGGRIACGVFRPQG